MTRKCFQKRQFLRWVLREGQAALKGVVMWEGRKRARKMGWGGPSEQ